MISRELINEASDTLGEIDIDSLIAVVRTSARYKANPAYFTNLSERLIATNGTLKAQQLNAVLDAIEALGLGQVEINQSQTVGTDGVIYSKVLEREALVDYALNVVYEELYDSVVVTDDDDSTRTLEGNYAVGRLNLIYKGYL